MPRLVIRKGEGSGKDHALGGPCIVGRHASANFVLGDTLVSRNHFRVFQEGQLWFVEDMGSRNGTLVNGRKMQKLQLSDGDLIAAGGTEVQFVQKDMLAAGGGKPVVPPAVRVPPVAVRPAPAAAVGERTAPIGPIPGVTVPVRPPPVVSPPKAVVAPAPPKPAATAAPKPADKPTVAAPVPRKRR